MKTIGIKLADGSFYPILEEGTAKTYQLDLTTVKDGQTKVQIDLYRSESGSMEDAQYVDTLEVSNLVPHPNGEADLHLSVALNEKNELDAKVIDEETGRKSETSVTLVSRTLAERANPANFELSEEQKDSAGQEKIDEIPKIAAGLDEPTFAEDDFAAETVEDSDFSEPEEGAQAEKPEELEFETVPFSFDSELENDVAEVDPDSKNDEPQAEGFKAEDEPAFDTKTDAPAEEKAESEEKLETGEKTETEQSAGIAPSPDETVFEPETISPAKEKSDCWRNTGHLHAAISALRAAGPCHSNRRRIPSPGPQLSHRSLFRGLPAHSCRRRFTIPYEPHFQTAKMKRIEKACLLA